MASEPSYAQIAGRLRELRAAAGNPSFATIVRLVAQVRARRGVPAAEQRPGRITVYDCFRDDRRRFDVGLVVDIGRALGLDDAQAREWDELCWALRYRVDAAAIVTARSALPEPPRRFVGRTEELARLLGDAGGPAVFVVSGMAGCGKTELVCEAARRLVAAGRAERAVFADLRGYAADRPPADAEAMKDAIADALEDGAPRLPQGRDRTATYRRRLVRRPTVLVLDDAASVAQVRALLPNHPRVVVLVTTRTAFAGAVDATEMPLDVLDPSAAVAFLRDATGRSLDEHDADALVLVESVGRLPLALGALASRISSHPDWTVADHAAAVASGAGTRLDVAVCAALDQSHESMSGEARRMLRLVAAQPFTDLSTAAVAALTATTLERADELVDELLMASMVTRPAPGRVTMHALVRAHGRERSLDEDRPADRVAGLAALLDHLVVTARAAVRVVERGYSIDVRYATTSPVELFDAPCAAAWLSAELQNLVDTTSEPCRAARPSVTIELSEIVSGFAFRNAHLRAGQTLAEHAIVAARQLGDRVGEALAEMHLVQFLWKRGMTEGSMLRLQRAEALLEPGDVRRISIKAMTATLAYERGDVQAALAIEVELADLAERAGRLRDASRLHDNAAVSLVRLGDLTGALRRFDRAYALAVAVEDHESATNALSNASEAHLAGGDARAALEVARRALEQCERHDVSVTMPFARTNAGAALAALGREDEALPLHRAALAEARAIGQRRCEATVLNNIGEAHLAAGRGDAAGEAFTAAAALAGELGDRLQHGRALAGSGRVALLDGDRVGARRQWERALGLLDATSPEADRVRADIGMSAVLDG